MTMRVSYFHGILNFNQCIETFTGMKLSTRLGMLANDKMRRGEQKLNLGEGMKCYAEKCPFGEKDGVINCGDNDICYAVIPEPEQSATAPVDSPATGSVSSLVEQKDAQIKALREQNQFLESKLYTYLIEIDKANKGLRRLSRRLEKKQNDNHEA